MENIIATTNYNKHWYITNLITNLNLHLGKLNQTYLHHSILNEATILLVESQHQQVKKAQKDYKRLMTTDKAKR